MRTMRIAVTISRIFAGSRNRLIEPLIRGRKRGNFSQQNCCRGTFCSFVLDGRIEWLIDSPAVLALPADVSFITTFTIEQIARF